MTMPHLTSDNWIKYHSKSTKGATTLFCFPYSGAGALAYKNWQDSVPSSIALAAIQLPGREARFSESSYEELQPLINDLGQAIVPHLTQSFAFFGHSFGSLLAFELTVWLENNNYPTPDRLFISSFRAPLVPAQKPHTYDLPRNEFIEKLKAYNGTDSSILKNKELIDIFLPALRADLKICESYHSRQPPALNIPITIYFGERDEHIPPETLAGWELCTTYPVEFKRFCGDHFYLNTEERYELINHLANQIAR